MGASRPASSANSHRNYPAGPARRRRGLLLGYGGMGRCSARSPGLPISPPPNSTVRYSATPATFVATGSYAAPPRRYAPLAPASPRRSRKPAGPWAETAADKPEPCPARRPSGIFFPARDCGRTVLAEHRPRIRNGPRLPDRASGRFLHECRPGGYTKAQTKSFYKEVRDRVAHMPGIAFAAWSSNMPLWARTVNGSRSKAASSDRKATPSGPSSIPSSPPISRLPASKSSPAGSSPISIATAPRQLPSSTRPCPASSGRPGPSAAGSNSRRNAASPNCGHRPHCELHRMGRAPAILRLPSARAELLGHHGPLRPNQGRSARSDRSGRAEIHAVGPQVVVTNPRTGRQIIDGGLFSARMGVAMLSVFGLLALGLASIGLYGILAYAAARRQREIGLRMALGASRISVLRLVLVQGMSPGVRRDRHRLRRVARRRPYLSRIALRRQRNRSPQLGAAPFILTLVALVACYLPARRATRVDPLTALRQI